ncbi:MAG: mannose-1-phosphate guanylyltransferase/mannose-6-phosphate isomerase [Gammaproteobacteria bacterium]|nr:mannose-1-phosphate guanylyltransferase/mannose-6-phosphate isomerase [Gammaproteobacteria bacterium]
MIIPVVLSGGAGTRLWPLSRGLYPKQLLPLVSERTMLQETVLRTSSIADCAAPLVVCNEAHRFLVAEQLRRIELEPHAILLEPVGRNTAPAVAVAAMHLVLAGDADARSQIMLVLPADHVIADEAAFHAAVTLGAEQARKGKLVTFGIVPDRAETGYGYIKKGEPCGDSSFAVERFVEKPAAAIAQEYFRSGEYLWNSGMFMFRVDRYLDELEKFQPEMIEHCRAAVTEAAEDLDFIRLGVDSFSASAGDSIDYAVMEKTDDAVVVPLAAGWSDVGDWSSLHAAKTPDDRNNVTVGDVLLEDCDDCYAHATSRMIAAVGLQDHVIVETADAVMVAPRSQSQHVKKIVEKLKNSERTETSLHREVFRPWGSYDSIDNGNRYQVKRLTVKPGAVLSLQKHHHRAEHWIVVTGTAEITRGEETFLLTENQSTYIPLGTVHRIANPGNVPLEIIEVQSGSYLGEDDIVRFEDTYGRAGRKD